VDPGETSPINPDTNGDGYSDLQNLDLVAKSLSMIPPRTTQRAKPSGNPGRALGTLVVGFWDSNRGIYAGQFGRQGTNRMSLTRSPSTGAYFFPTWMCAVVDGSPYGDAGDPVLVADRASGVIYYAATSERNEAAHRGVPLWKSVNKGASFIRCPTVHEDILHTDYPWIAVDDWPAWANTCLCRHLGVDRLPQYLMVSTDGNGANWSEKKTIGDSGSSMPQLVVGPNHVAYVAWRRCNHRLLIHYSSAPYQSRHEYQCAGQDLRLANDGSSVVIETRQLDP